MDHPARPCALVPRTIDRNPHICRVQPWNSIRSCIFFQDKLVNDLGCVKANSPSEVGLVQQWPLLPTSKSLRVSDHIYVTSLTQCIDWPRKHRQKTFYFMDFSQGNDTSCGRCSFSGWLFQWMGYDGLCVEQYSRTIRSLLRSWITSHLVNEYVNDDTWYAEPAQSYLRGRSPAQVDSVELPRAVQPGE